jgi:melibiose permease/lactose/raffinose/galactose permease
MAETVLTEEKLSSRTKWSFTVGGIGRDMAYNLYSAYLLAFIMLTKGIDNSQFAVISTIIIICRIWDAINDPVMGGIIENTRSKWGKFKPWIFIGAISNAIILLLVFTVPLKGWAFIIAFIFFYLLWDITFTMNDIGYWSMLPALSSDPKTRSTLTAMANLFASIGAILALGLIPVLTAGNATLGGNAVTAYAIIAVVISLSFVGCQMLTVFGVKENHGSLVTAEKMSIKRMAKIILKNDQLLWIALSMVLYNFGSSLILAFGSIYVYFEFGYNGFLVTVLTAAYATATILANLFYPKLASKFSRKKIQIYSIATSIFGYLMFFFTGILWPMNFATLAVSLLFMGYGQITYYAVLTVSISNTVEYNEYISGTRDESLIFSVRPFMAKLGSSLQQLAIMVVYLAVGVTAYTKQISDLENATKMGLITEAEKLAQIQGVIDSVTEPMKLSLRACIAFIPIVLLIASYIVIRYKYKIDEKYYSNMLKELAERRNSATQEK